MKTPAGKNMPCKVPASISVHHLIIIDESVSMARISAQTVSGCNETIQTIRKMQSVNPDQHHFVSIYLFRSGSSRYIHKDVPAMGIRGHVHLFSMPSALL